MHFGNEFKKLVDGRAENCEEIARALGFKSKSSISYYSKCAKRPKSDILDRICDFFEVSPDYFDDMKKGGKFVLHQPKNKYEVQKSIIPVYSDGFDVSLKIGEVAMGSLGINDGFAIVVGENLAKFGFPAGVTLFMTRKIEIAAANIVIMQDGDEKYFANCEQRGKNIFIYPIDRTKEPIKLSKNKDENIKIYASLNHVLIKPDLFNLRR